MLMWFGEFLKILLRRFKELLQMLIRRFYEGMTGKMKKSVIIVLCVIFPTIFSVPPASAQTGPESLLASSLRALAMSSPCVFHGIHSRRSPGSISHTGNRMQII